MIEQGFVSLCRARPQSKPSRRLAAFSRSFPRIRLSRVGAIQRSPIRQTTFWPDRWISTPGTYRSIAMPRHASRLSCWRRRIDAVLNGYAGTLADPDHTVVQGILRTNRRDFFDDERRTYRRMLEYEVWSNSNAGP